MREAKSLGGGVTDLGPSPWPLTACLTLDKLPHLENGVCVGVLAPLTSPGQREA